MPDTYFIAVGFILTAAIWFRIGWVCGEIRALDRTLKALREKVRQDEGRTDD